jgi:DNA-binding NtrC family response regulator
MKTILVIDDDHTQLGVLPQLVEFAYHPENVTVIARDNHASACDLVRTIRFDQVLTDLETDKGFEGFETAKFIRSKNPETDIVGMTGRPGVTLEEWEVRTIIAKPFTVDTLRKVLVNRENAEDQRRELTSV